MNVKISQIADLIKADIEGNPDEFITHPDKIESAQAGAITFFSNPKYEKFLYQTQASAVLLDKNYKLTQPVPATLLRVENVYLALSALFEYFDKNRVKKEGVSKLAVVGEGVKMGKGVYIGPYAVVEDNVTIGDDAQIGPQVYIGAGTQIGHQVKIYPGVRIYHDCHIGDRVILHSNAVIGSDGFGFAPNEAGEYTKIPQIGVVVIGDDVEIGANTVVDRASMGKTIVSAGTKLDNLIQVGHSVVIGKNCVIAAQTGIAGSTRIGDNAQIGGHVGIAGHLNLGDNIKLGGMAGVNSNLKSEGEYFGAPAFELNNYMRSYVVFKNLPDLRKEVIQLRKQLDELSKRNTEG